MRARKVWPRGLVSGVWAPELPRRVPLFQVPARVLGVCPSLPLEDLQNAARGRTEGYRGAMEEVKEAPTEREDREDRGGLLPRVCCVEAGEMGGAIWRGQERLTRH